MPCLYAHLVLPSPEAGAALRGTLGSVRWTTGELGGKAEEWVKAVTFGRKGGGGAPTEGVYVEEVLVGLGGAELERVAVVGLRLGEGAFERMASVRYLHLDRVAYAIRYNAQFSLPRLSHLSLTNLDIPGQYSQILFSALSLPALRYLAVSSTPSTPPNPDPDPHAVGVFHVASQLRLVALRGYQPQSTLELGMAAPAMASLDVLVFRATVGLGKILAALPRSLTVLDLAALPFRPRLADEARGLLEEGHGSVRALNVLRLPRVEDSVVDEPAGAAVAVALAQVAKAAESCGVAVEWE